MISTLLPKIKSIQYGNVSVTTAGGTYTINAVDVNKSVVNYLGYTGAGSSSVNYIRGECKLTNSTTVTCYSNTANSCPTYFQVVEYY